MVFLDAGKAFCCLLTKAKAKQNPTKFFCLKISVFVTGVAMTTDLWDD